MNLPRPPDRPAWIAVYAAICLAGCSGPAPAPAPPSPAEAAAAEAEADATAAAKLLERAGALTDQLNALKREEITSVDQAVATIRLFQDVTLTLGGVNDASASEQVKVEKGSLADLLVKRQVQLFPHLRRTYADHMARELGGVAVYVRAGGAGNRTFRIASPTFGSRDAVMQAHYSIAGQLTRFRFAKAEYVYTIDGANYGMKVQGPADDSITY